MAKSKRSKVKMAHRAMRRAVMQPKLDAQLHEQASKVYAAIGLPMPNSDQQESTDVKNPAVRARSHGGSEIVSTFTPTPKAPTLNAVHGPLANRRAMQIESDVVGFPIVGAGQRARLASSRNVKRMRDDDGKDGDDGEQTKERTPYFYNRRYKFDRSIRKQRRMQKKSLKPHALRAMAMEVEASTPSS